MFRDTIIKALIQNGKLWPSLLIYPQPLYSEVSVVFWESTARTLREKLFLRFDC